MTTIAMKKARVRLSEITDPGSRWTGIWQIATHVTAHDPGATPHQDRQGHRYLMVRRRAGRKRRRLQREMDRAAMVFFSNPVAISLFAT